MKVFSPKLSLEIPTRKALSRQSFDVVRRHLTAVLAVCFHNSRWRGFGLELVHEVEDTRSSHKYKYKNLNSVYANNSSSCFRHNLVPRTNYIFTHARQNNLALG